MKIESMKTYDRKGISMLVFADGGTGKTSLAKTVENPLVINADGGMVALLDTNIEYVTVMDDLSNLNDIFDSVEGMDTYPTMILDSATELEKMLLIHHGKRSRNEGAPTQNDYNIVYFKERDYLRRFRNLRDKGVDVIVTALEMPLELEQDEGIIRTRAYPMLGKSLAPEIVGLFDIVAHMEISSKKGHKGERYLRLQPTEKVVAKNRYTEDQFWPADLGSLINKIRPMADSGEEE